MCTTGSLILPRAPPTKAVRPPAGARCGPGERPRLHGPGRAACAALSSRQALLCVCSARLRKQEQVSGVRPACSAKQRSRGTPEAGPGRSGCTLQATSYATPSATRPGAEATRPLGLCVLAPRSAQGTLIPRAVLFCRPALTERACLQTAILLAGVKKVLHRQQAARLARQTWMPRARGVRPARAPHLRREPWCLPPAR
jgi:hypothetical protein